MAGDLSNDFKREALRNLSQEIPARARIISGAGFFIGACHINC